MNILRWVFAVLLAAFFAYMGSFKFIFSEPNLVFSTIAQNSGIGLFEPVVRVATGVAEFLVALLLLIPRTRLMGALLALAVLIGAIGFHLSPWLGIVVPGLDAPLFQMAIGGLILTLIVFLLEWRVGKAITES